MKISVARCTQPRALKLHLPSRSFEKRKICSLVVILLGFVSFELRAQSVWQGTNSALWDSSSNWANGITPNIAGAEAQFTNAANVNMNDFTATIGTLSANHGTGNVVLGAVGSNNTIIFDAGDPLVTPTVNVTNPNSIVFMYANAFGTNGLRKSGPGKFTFRNNLADQSYSGGIFLNGGTFGLNQGGSLGDATNEISVESSSTILSEPGANTGTVTISNTHRISLNGNLTINNGNSNVITSIEADITGGGNLIFGGTGGLRLSGQNYYSGGLTINGPGFGGVATNATIVARTNLVALAGENSLSEFILPFTLTFGTTAATNSSSTINVDLGGFSRSPASLVISNNTATTSTNSTMIFNITNGGLSFSDPLGTFGFSSRGAGAVTNDLRLPGDSSLTYSNISIGTVGASQNAMINSRILIGTNATLNANQFTLAAYRASGSIEAQQSGASLRMRAADGSSPVSQILIGNFSGGPNPVASIGLTNGAVDISATEIVVGKNVANNSAASASLSFNNGTLTAKTLVVGNGANVGGAVSVTNTNVLTATVTHHGGVATISNIVMGRSVAQGASNGPILDKYTSAYNLNGGTLAAALINTDSTNTAISGMTRTFNLNGGTLRGYDAGSDLTITATTNSFAAIGFYAGTTNAKTIAVDSGRSINFSGGVEFQANGGVTTFALESNSVATLSGRFRIGVSGTNDASVLITNGIVNLSSATQILALGDRTNGSSVLNISGGTLNISLSNNRMLVGSKFNSFVSVSGGSLVVSGNQPIYVGGDTQYGANGAQGTWTITGGSARVSGSADFVLGQNSYLTTNNITSNSIGILNLNGGEFITTRAITKGVNTNGTSSTGIVRFNGGKLTAGTNLPVLMNVTTAEIQSGGATIDTGGFDVTNSQSLSGAGKLTKVGAGTLTLSGNNSYTGDTDVNAGALSLLGAVASPNINVTNGAALVLNVATNRSITNNITFSAGAKVRVDGTPSGSVNLLTTSGTISGSPELETGIPGYTLVTSNSTITLQENVNSTPPTITSPNAFTGTVGVWFSNNITATGAAPIAFSGTNLPSGLSVASGGQITGTPTAAGTNTATLTASNFFGAPVQSVMFTIAKGTQTTVSGNLVSATITFGETTTVTASGGLGTGAYEFRQNGGTGAVSFSGVGSSRTISTTSVGTAVIEVRRVADGNYNDSAWASAGTLTVNPAGASFSDWNSGGETNSLLVGKYAIGGASNSSADAEKPVVNVDSNTLSLSAIVRTNDSKLDVVGEAAGSLTNWSTNGISVAVSTNTNGVPAGHQRKVFSVDRTNAPTKQFLRLKATLTP